MRITIVHSMYSSRQPSGENVVVEAQAEALRQGGHEVQLLAASTDSLAAKPGYQAMAAWRTATGYGGSQLEALTSFRPDVVHVHNLFPNMGWRWLMKWGGAIIVTLHNFRYLCPAATLIRDGQGCEICPSEKRTTSAIRYGCYRNSFATIPVAMGTRFDRHPLLRRADKIVTLSAEMSRKYETYGIPSKKLCVVKNFTSFAANESSSNHERHGWVYVGRLSPEKNIQELVQNWPAGYKLTIVGDGPLRAVLEGQNRQDVTLVGALDSWQVADVLKKSEGLVFPSRSRETLALVCLEALACGTPIATFGDTPAGIEVSQLKIGKTFSNWSELARTLDEVVTSIDSLTANCQEVYRDQFSTETWLLRQLEIYREAMRSHAE